MITNTEFWREALDLLDPNRDPAAPLPDLEELEDLADEEGLEEMGAAPPAAGQAATCPGCGEGESYASARARREVSKADREALELRRRRGELLSRGEAESAFNAIGGGVSLYLRGLADREGAVIFAEARNPTTTERGFELFLDDMIARAIADFIADIERIRAGLPALNPDMEVKGASELYAEGRDYRKNHRAQCREPELAKGDPV